MEIVINCNYGGLNPVLYGREVCDPSHAFGPQVRTHWLLHYVVSGSGIFRRDGKTHRVSAGEIFVIPPYVESFYQADEVHPWEYIWIGFTTESPLPEVFSNPVIPCPEGERIFGKMRLCGEYEGGRSAYLAACLWELTSVLLEQGKHTTDYVDKALNCIHSEYSTRLTVQEIARRLNLDRSYFSTLFTRRVGTSPEEYLRTYRLNKAAELMTRYGESPTTAASSVGFDDLFHFSKAFKQRFGISPREYVKREKNRN